MTTVEPPDDVLDAAADLYDLALELQERSQSAQAALIEEFEEFARAMSPSIGHLPLRRRVDEEVWLDPDGTIRARVIPEVNGRALDQWEDLDTPRDIVEFLDATDVFGDVAEAIAKAFPGAVPSEPSAKGSTAQARPTSHMPDMGETPLLEAEGNGGYIWVFHDKVRLKHHGMRGLLTKGAQKGDKEIWIDQIAGIQWREPGNLWLGHLQFELIGGGSATRVATEDENAVMFDARHRDQFSSVKLLVERRMREIRSERVQSAAAPAVADIPDQISKLAELRDAGVLTSEEFDAKKVQLLERM